MNKINWAGIIRWGVWGIVVGFAVAFGILEVIDFDLSATADKVLLFGIWGLVFLAFVITGAKSETKVLFKESASSFKFLLGLFGLTNIYAVKVIYDSWLGGSLLFNNPQSITNTISILVSVVLGAVLLYTALYFDDIVLTKKKFLLNVLWAGGVVFVVSYLIVYITFGEEFDFVVFLIGTGVWLYLIINAKRLLGKE